MNKAAVFRSWQVEIGFAEPLDYTLEMYEANQFRL